MRFTLSVLLGFFFTASQAQQVSVALPAMNVVYIGLHNPVNIAVEGYKNSEVVTMTEGIELVFKGGKHYLLAKERGEATLIIGVKEKKDTVWLETATFRVRNIPKPKPLMGTLEDGDEQSVGTIRANAVGIYMSLGEGFAPEGVVGRVVSYTFSVVDSLGYFSIPVSGGSLPAIAKGSIRHLNPGAKIMVTNIRYVIYGNGDTLWPETLSSKIVQISTRNSATSSYMVMGGFSDTSAEFKYHSTFTNKHYLPQFLGKTKHGRWVYSSGWHNPKVYLEEYYDTGRITRYIVYDSAGNILIDASKKPNVDTMYIRELYPDGNLHREGWVATDQANYYFGGEIPYNEYHGSMADNSFREYFETMKFIPLGTWKEYYPNGKLQLKATFGKYEHKFIDGSPRVNYMILMDGVWEVFNNKGELLKKFPYQEGVYKGDDRL